MTKKEEMGKVLLHLVMNTPGKSSKHSSDEFLPQKPFNLTKKVDETVISLLSNIYEAIYSLIEIDRGFQPLQMYPTELKKML